MKRCPEYQRLLLEHLYELLESDQQRELEAHLTECLECRAALERAHQEQAWLREASCWSFSDVRFDRPTLAEPSRSKDKVIGTAASAALTFLLDNLPMWTLAGSLLLAIGLALWWAASWTSESTDWAAYHQDKSGKASFVFTKEGHSPEVQSLPQLGQAAGSVPQLAAQSPPRAPEGSRRQAVNDLCAQQDVTRKAQSSFGAVPTSPARGGRQSGQGVFAAASEPVPESLRRTQGAQLPPEVNTAHALAAKAGKEDRGGMVLRSQAVDSLRGVENSLRDFTVFRVTRIPGGEQFSVRVEVIEFPDSHREGQVAMRAAGQSIWKNNAPLALIAPVEIPERAVADKIAGAPENNATASSPQGSPVAPLQNSALAGERLQSQVGNVARHNLVKTQVGQEFFAQLPRGYPLANVPSAHLSVEVPVEQGGLSLLVAAVRLPVESFHWLPALRLQREAGTRRLRVQVIPVDATTLSPIEVQTTLHAQLLDEKGRCLDDKVLASQRAPFAGKLAGQPAESGTAAKALLYETVLTLPANRVSECWLRLSDERRLLPTMSLLLLPQQGADGQGKGSSPCESTPKGRSFRPIMNVPTTVAKNLNYTSQEDQSCAENCQDPMIWESVVCCCDEMLALQLGLLARRYDGALERSIYEQIRAHVRKQTEKKNLPQPTWASLGHVHVSGRAANPARLQESQRLTEFLLQIIPTAQSGGARITVVGLGLLIALGGGLAFACGVFGAVNGRASYLCWSRRIVSLALVLAALWWAWNSAGAQVPTQKGSPRTLQPASPSAVCSM